MTDFSNLGSSVSLRNFYGLGASLAVFDDSCLGSSVALRSARWSIPALCGLWTPSTLRETIWCLLGLGYSLASSALARSPRICAVGLGSCASSVVLGFHGMLEYWLKFQVCWWIYLALTLAMSLLGVQRACIATDATIGCWMVCFENARCASQSDPCLAKFKLLYPASSQLMGDHDSEVCKFSSGMHPRYHDFLLSSAPLHMPNDFSNRVRRHHE